jgi:amidohydrolase
MPIPSRVTDLVEEITGWRRDFHAHPELLFDVHRTAGLVASRLEQFGCDEVVRGIGRTGVVGVIRGQQKGNEEGRVIALRADMDALPIQEAVDRPYKSTVAGTMHACGHDGHTAMLLGAARYLCETRQFCGTAIVVFQPAEEGGGGGEVMVQEGLMERFGIQEIYGLHNMPGIPLGHFAVRPGPIMAAADRFSIQIEGKGGHAARPHLCVDPILVASQIVVALQSVVARSIDPLDAAVVSIGMLRSGDTFNVIPQAATLLGTTRSLRDEVRNLCETRIKSIAHSIAQAHDATVNISYNRGYPVTINHPEQTSFLADMAAHVVGSEHVDTQIPPLMGAEDFSYMLNRRPGAYIFLGNGDTAGVHHPAYDFNDEAIPYGVSLWAKVIETRMAS